MTKTIKPTPAQLEELKYAMTDGKTWSHSPEKPVGRLRRIGISETTLGILTSKGWARKGALIEDLDERAKMKETMFDHVESAKGMLEKGFWEDALSELKQAYNVNLSLNTEAHWITDAGKEELGASVKS